MSICHTNTINMQNEMYADTLGWQFYLSELLNRQCRIRIPQNKGALSAIISSIYKNLNIFVWKI